LAGEGHAVGLFDLGLVGRFVLSEYGSETNHVGLGPV